MAFKFSVYIYPGTDLAAAFERAKQEAARSSHDVVLSGNTVSGSIRGEIEGSYSVNGDEIDFVIAKKPAFLTEDSLKDAVKKFF